MVEGGSYGRIQFEFFRNRVKGVEGNKNEKHDGLGGHRDWCKAATSWLDQY